ncbi:N-acetylmuramoyl-L-alanine amidase [Litchfieldia alkalitelluris]|uniref:N-acetylmuramoyl-L-alanine amidase n=1 Tax=Litchfieldia alkalitelluris TaxID=304268 RepID=UPI000995F0DD|nr:N-acetylmuramoyl-L-alanine amidase [Litchfieldia alkalitelluris]
MKIMIDAGHGPNTPGKRSPDGMKEFDFNSRVADVMKAELEKYEGAEIYFAHAKNDDVSLNERTEKANKLKVDVYVSLHANAFRGVMGDHTGIETYVYSTNPKEARKLADKIQAALVKATGLANRGVKLANFHVLRETAMSAILIEHGYMDSKIDLPKLKSDAFRKLCGETNAKALAEFYGLKRKPEPKPKPVASKSNVLYKVQVGAFASKDNAEKLAAKLNKDGYNTYIVEEAKK